MERLHSQLTIKPPKHLPSARRAAIAQSAPLLIGSANCESMLGCPWRWLRRHADELGLKVVKVDGKVFIDAAETARALLNAGPVDYAEPDEVKHVDELAAMRAQLGKRRIIG